MSELSCWSGQASPHQLAEALSLILPRLAPDSRARAACVSRAWRAATLHPALWEELRFERCAARVTDATLASLCKRAGAALRMLNLEAVACKRVTSDGVLAALRDGGCTGLRWLILLQETFVPAVVAQQLAAACPMLRTAACTVYCYLSYAVAASTALPGPLKLWCDCCVDKSEAGVLAQLAECLRDNTSLAGLDLGFCSMGDTGAAQLADGLRNNATLTDLSLCDNSIGDAGATQLAECLRINVTLKSLNLGSNNIGETGATQLAECLTFNATLESLDLYDNLFGDAGATRLAGCLRVNATLTSLNLSENGICETGATQMAESLRVNTKLKHLDMRGNDFGDVSARALQSACPPKCTLLLPWGPVA